MKPESFAILRHIIDTMFMIVLATIIVLVAWTFGHAYFKTVKAWIAQVEYVYMAVTVIGISAVLGWSFPKKVRASFRSLKLLPRHWGLVVRGFLGCVLTMLLACLIGLLKVKTGQLALLIIGVIGIEGLALFVGVVLAKLHLCIHDRTTCIGKNVDIDDRPIRILEENLFPEYEVTARRILGQIELGKNKRTKGPNVAVIGPYGSGKTSLCYLVEDINRKERDKGIGSDLVFCRFEAWPFLTADAAVRGLLDEIVSKVQELVDCSRLGAVPEEYLEALRACPNGWFGMIATILGKRRNPEEVIMAIQDILSRIGARVVVFVDDFDRLESTSRETQGAISAALNQLQNLTTVQYVLCVGPMHEGPGADLLKLTRFQELMPEVRGQEVIERMQELRDEAIRGQQEMYYPWDLKKEDNDDPLKYYFHRDVLKTTLVSKLVNLIETPRQLKAVEREMHEKWKHGLKGEISWYDLLLMSALKVGEPGVFEWVMREQEVFQDEEIHITEPTEEEKKEAKSAIENKLRELIRIKTKSRLEIIQQVLLDLFPNFMKGLGGLAQWRTRGEPQPWEQRIAIKIGYGTSYFRRYISGCVPSTEVPDQPILQYIRDIKNNGFEQKEFEQRYLESFHKLTNDLNRFVQLSGLLSKELASVVCECILDWMCDRQHWSVWDQKEEYVSAVMSDVMSIVKNAGQFEFAHTRREIPLSHGQETDLEEWAKEQLERLASADAIVAIEYVKYVAKDLLGEKEAKGLLGATLKKEFLGNQEAFWEKAKGSRLYLSWLLGVLKYNDDYENIRDQVTLSVVERTEVDKSEEFAGSVVISLVNYSFSAGRPDFADGYQFFVKKEENQKTFNMDMLLPLIAGWKGRQFEDQVVAKSFEHFMRAYAEEMGGDVP